jgi:hypothetical protein
MNDTESMIIFSLLVIVVACKYITKPPDNTFIN